MVSTCCAYTIFVGITQVMHLQSLMQALLTFTKQKTPSWAMSTAQRFVPLHPLSRSREFPFPPFRYLLLIGGPLPASETPQSSSLVVSRATLRQSQSCCGLVTLLSCLDLRAVVHTTAFHAYSRVRYQLILGRVPMSMTDCGHRMRGTWTRRELTSTCGKYFPRGSTLALHKHKTVAELTVWHGCMLFKL
jgi:hypothetical protein